MLEEVEEGSLMTEETDNPLEENELGPTSIDVTDQRISIGPTSIDVTDEQASIVKTSPAEQQEEKVQEQNKQIEQAQEESKIIKRKQKRRMTSHLSNILRQVEKHGNQLNKMALMIQSLQKQKRTTPTVDTGIGKLQSQSTKQIQSQISHLQKQVTQIQKDIQRLITVPTKRTNTRLRKLSSTIGIKPRSKKSKSLKNTKARKGR
jgi:hypothetical protein